MSTSEHDYASVISQADTKRGNKIQNQAWERNNSVTRPLNLEASVNTPGDDHLVDPDVFIVNRSIGSQWEESSNPNLSQEKIKEEESNIDINDQKIPMIDLPPYSTNISSISSKQVNSEVTSTIQVHGHGVQIPQLREVAHRPRLVAEPLPQVQLTECDPMFSQPVTVTPDRLQHRRSLDAITSPYGRYGSVGSVARMHGGGLRMSNARPNHNVEGYPLKLKYNSTKPSVTKLPKLPPCISISKVEPKVEDHNQNLSNWGRVLSMLGDSDGTKREVVFRMTDAQVRALGVLGVKEAE